VSPGSSHVRTPASLTAACEAACRKGDITVDAITKGDQGMYM
jgi:hypothetical protein